MVMVMTDAAKIILDQCVQSGPTRSYAVGADFVATAFPGGRDEIEEFIREHDLAVLWPCPFGARDTYAFQSLPPKSTR